MGKFSRALMPCQLLYKNQTKPQPLKKNNNSPLSFVFKIYYCLLELKCYSSSSKNRATYMVKNTGHPALKNLWHKGICLGGFFVFFKHSPLLCILLQTQSSVEKQSSSSLTSLYCFDASPSGSYLTILIFNLSASFCAASLACIS